MRLRPESPNNSDERDRIRRILRELDERSPARMAAERLLSGERSVEDVGELIRLVGKASDRRSPERMVAAWALSHAQLTPEENEAAASVLCSVLDRKENGAKIRTGWRLFRSGFTTLAIELILSIGVFYLVYTRAPDPDSEAERVAFRWILLWFVSAWVALWAVPPMTMRWLDRRHGYVRASATTALGRMGVARSAGSLARVFANDAGQDLANRARTALQEVLPRLTAEDYGRLDPTTTPALCDLLTTSDADLFLAIHRALGAAGNGSALEPVREASKRGRTPELRAAAEAILPVLEERLRAESAARILLRPTAGPTDASQMLLRPAGVGEGGVESLLHPADQPSPGNGRGEIRPGSEEPRAGREDCQPACLSDEAVNTSSNTERL